MLHRSCKGEKRLAIRFLADEIHGVEHDRGILHGEVVDFVAAEADVRELFRESREGFHRRSRFFKSSENLLVNGLVDQSDGVAATSGTIEEEVEELRFVDAGRAGGQRAVEEGGKVEEMVEATTLVDVVEVLTWHLILVVFCDTSLFKEESVGARYFEVLRQRTTECSTEMSHFRVFR